MISSSWRNSGKKKKNERTIQHKASPTVKKITMIVFNIWRTIGITVFSPMSGNIVNSHVRSYPLFKIGKVSDEKHKKASANSKNLQLNNLGRAV